MIDYTTEAEVYSMDYQKVLNELTQASDEKYRVFNESLIPGVRKTYGVRIPALRTMAKQLAPNWQDFIACAQDDSQEEIMLQGLVIGYARIPTEERLKLLTDFIPKIDNWAVCDTVCSTLKFISKDLFGFRLFLEPYMQSVDEFGRRFAIICLMDYYITDEYIEEVLDYLAATDHPAYYVQMAAAWALSVCFVKYRELTLPYFCDGLIVNDWINNKAIQKCRESYRVTAEDKALLIGFKR